MFFFYHRVYLRDSEREQLSQQALELCTQSLRSRIKSMGSEKTNDTMQNSLVRTDSRTLVLLDSYLIYQQAQKNFQGNQQSGPNKDHWITQTINTLRSLLVEAYKTYMGITVSTLEHFRRNLLVFEY